MGLTDEERERLTAIFYKGLDKYVSSTRTCRKRPAGENLIIINQRHDARMWSNPWVRLAFEGVHPDAQT